MRGFFYPPQVTFGDPSATSVQPEMESSTLPQPLPFIVTVVDPVVIPAAWPGHGGTFGGSLCGVFKSPFRDTEIPLQVTFGEPSALVMGEQCTISASPIRVTALVIVSVSVFQQISPENFPVFHGPLGCGVQESLRG